jgi:hypothetical protein
MDHVGGGIHHFYLQCTGWIPAIWPWPTSRDSGTGRLPIISGGKKSRHGEQFIVSPTIRNSISFCVSQLLSVSWQSCVPSCSGEKEVTGGFNCEKGRYIVFFLKTFCSLDTCSACWDNRLVLVSLSKGQRSATFLRYLYRAHLRQLTTDIKIMSIEYVRKDSFPRDCDLNFKPVCNNLLFFF